jgi:hypothetical protein
MGKVGHQDFWIVGSRFYFQRDPVDGVSQPYRDIGVIDVANPAITIEEAKLIDPDGGTQRTVDTGLSGIDEAYDITCKNINLQNLSLLFLAQPPEAFTQSAANHDVVLSGFAGELLKITDGDQFNPVNLFNLSRITGVYKGSVTAKVVTAISASARTITVTGAVTVADGDPIIVKPNGLANPANAGTYTARGAQSSVTAIAVNEFPVANEVAITGAGLLKGTGTILKRGVDWDVVSLDRGFLKFIEGGAGTTDSWNVLFSTNAVSGDRVFNPQTVNGAVFGKAMIIFSRGNNAQQSVRECYVSLSPSSSALSDTDYSSITFRVTVIEDPNASTPAGRFLQFKGELPAKS